MKKQGSAGGRMNNKKELSSFLLPFFLSGIMLYLSPGSLALAANIATAGQDDGYSGRILDKITRKWKPPHPLGKYRLNIVLAVEGDGNLADCRIQKSSGFEALDVSACAAARAAAPFGQPPYGMPASIFFSFWSDNDQTPRTNPDPQAPDAHLAMMERQAAIAANERAQAAAELAAKKTGKKLDISKSGPDAGNAGNVKASKLKTAKPVSGIKTAADGEKAANEPENESPAREKEKIAAVASAPLAPKAATQPDLQGNTLPEAVDENRYARYLSRVRWDLRNRMYIPVETKPGTYHALVEIKCDRNGKILSSNMLKDSGDAVLDRYVMAGIKRAGRVQPPPAGFGDTFKIYFTLVRN